MQSSHRYDMAKVQGSVSVNVLVTEIQKHLLDYGGPRHVKCEETVKHEVLCDETEETVEHVLNLLGHFRAQRMGLTEFCVRLRVLVGATVLKATVQGLSRQAAAASPRACRNDTSKERPAKRSLVKEEPEEEVASPAGVSMGTGSPTPPRKRRAPCSGNSVGDWTPAEEARHRAIPTLEVQTGADDATGDQSPRTWRAADHGSPVDGS
eukprot:scaffold81114_cov59-Phaeocystis_antarctica.AAC.8